MRVLIVSNMWPSPAAPAFGAFVRDQVDALRALGDPDLELDVFSFTDGDYLAAARALRREHGGERFDVVHAHFGLTAWPALAARARARVVQLHGTDVRHRRSRRITQAAFPFQDLVAVVSENLERALPPGARTTAVLPCGVAPRFRPIDRATARAELDLDPDGRYLFFPADPRRPEKRLDRARRLAVEAGADLLVGGQIEPERMPLWMNAANAVVVPSDDEGFGLAVLEALACDVPVAATSVGIHLEALDGVDGTLCAPFHAEAWAAAVRPALADPGARIAGRERAERWSAARMAARLVEAWRQVLAAKGTR
jgi:teichuronic acid biosynthesis glycosyltransferase TuaC